MKKVLFARYVRGVIQASMVLAFPCAITISASALAASPPGEYGGLEEIVVTAEKRESTVQATPIAMTALSAKLTSRTGGDAYELEIPRSRPPIMSLKRSR